MIAALYVETNGVYFGIGGIDPWDIQRDARSYTGPHRVIAHPPCQRWGRYWSGGPSAKVRRKLGDDQGCFATALWAVRTFGGVLEHPEASKAWEWFGLAKPPKNGGWIPADSYGVTCCVEQGHYGHAARKATWLYAVNCGQPELLWGACTSRQRLEPGFHSKEERARASRDQKLIKRISSAQMVNTPVDFRDLLIKIVR